ncbi:MAG: PF20097 family protein [Eubacteriales bacterium]|nr:PF20097 family protein [Eubacteriales bacterium]
MKCPYCGKEMVKGNLKGMDPAQDQLSVGKFFALRKEADSLKKKKSQADYLVGSIRESWACPNCMRVVTIRDMVQN